MKRLFLLVALVAIPISACAQFHSDEFKNYKDYSIPKPADFVKVTAADLKLTDAFLDQYPDGTPTLTRQGLSEMYEFYMNTDEGKKEWSGLVSQAARIVGAWNIELAGGFNRYIYSLSCLKPISTVYMFTGNKMLLAFIRGHLAKIAALPIDFWVHAELRGLNPEHPKGALETAQLNTMLGFALAACKKDMTPDEINAIESAWYERGHRTAYNWLDSFKKNNWTAVIASGLFYSSAYFKDADAKERAMKGLKYYADSTIEEDGSYAEGEGYFTYPIGTLLTAALVMTPEEIEKVYGDSSLKNSMRWRLYGQLFNTDNPESRGGTWRISYGDNSFGGNALLGEDKPSLMCEVIYKDGVAAWMREKFGSKVSSDEIILRSKYPGRNIVPTSPRMAKMPLAAAFKSGDCYIRGSWEDNDIVLGIKTGDAGEKIGYSHSRPEYNSITLGAFGEYIIVACGSSSYRGSLHYDFDMATCGANTISIDGKNMFHPSNAHVSKGKWDDTAIWMKGFPKVTETVENLPDGAIIKTDARTAYHVKTSEASRTVRFWSDPGFFIVVDKIVTDDGYSHKFENRLHIYNRDGMTSVSGKDDALKILRGKADVYISSRSKESAKLVKEDGYLHDPSGRDYDPHGPKEGKPGSSIGLNWTSEGKSLENVMVIFPKKAGSKAPKIKFAGNKVSVDGKSYDIPE